MVIIALLCVCDYFHYAMWITNENNRRIIGMLGRIIGEIFKNYRIGKIKSVLLGSGLDLRSSRI